MLNTSRYARVKNQLAKTCEPKIPQYLLDFKVPAAAAARSVYAEWDPEYDDDGVTADIRRKMAEAILDVVIDVEQVLDAQLITRHNDTEDCNVGVKTLDGTFEISIDDDVYESYAFTTYDDEVTDRLGKRMSVKIADTDINIVRTSSDPEMYGYFLPTAF